MTADRAVVLVRGGHVLTMGPAGDVTLGAVALDTVSGEILDVGPHDALARRFPAATTRGGEHDIVVPGFVNGHDHLSEALISGLGETMGLYEWQERLIRPVVACLTPEIAKAGTLLKGAEMIQSGITCVNDMFVHTNSGSLASLGVVDGLEELGMRGTVSFGASDLPDPLPVAELIGEHERLARRADESPLVGFRMGLSTVHSLSDALLEASVEAARRHGWAVHTHLAEVREELSETRLRFGGTNLDRARESGLLDLDVVFAHCIWVLEPDVSALAEHGSTVVHNPLSNMILASGVCPVPRLRSAGIPVGLGTDGAASNDSHDMLQVVKMSALLQKLEHLDAQALTARDALEMATAEGARALGLSDAVGSLEPGKRADVVRFSAGGPRLAYVHDPYQQLAYCAGPGDVADVWIDGRQVLRDGDLQTVDVRAVVGDARRLAGELSEAAGLKVLVDHGPGTTGAQGAT